MARTSKTAQLTEDLAALAATLDAGTAPDAEAPAEQAGFDLAGLVPQYRPGEFVTQYLAVDNLPQGSGGRYPDKQFLDSVDRHGVLVPLVVEQNGLNYRIVDGWKRLTAARAMGLTQVPVVLVDAGDEVNADVASLAANNLRSSNMAAEYRALARLMEEHGDLKKIAAASGVKYQTLYRLWKLRKLDPRLLQALEDGQISAWTAEEAATHPPDAQERLLAIIEEKGKATTKDVVDIRRRRVADKVRAAQTSHGDLFSAPSLGGDDASDDGADDEDILADREATSPVAIATGTTVEDAPDTGKRKKATYLEPQVRAVSPKVAAKQAHPQVSAIAHLESAINLLQVGEPDDAALDAIGLAREAIAKLRGEL